MTQCHPLTLRGTAPHPSYPLFPSHSSKFSSSKSRSLKSYSSYSSKSAARFIHAITHRRHFYYHDIISSTKTHFRLPQPFLRHSAKQLLDTSVSFGWRWDDQEMVADNEGASFDAGVELFNTGEYYGCHDVFERLWNNAAEPQRGVIHGLLQCAVALYHLSNQNHRGAMVELGEGLCKLRRFELKKGPFYDFVKEASALLEFIYNTQLEHAACADNSCITMDGSEQSYQLLGDFAAGECLYRFHRKAEGGPVYIEFTSNSSSVDLALPNSLPMITKLPQLHASEDDLNGLHTGND